MSWLSLFHRTVVRVPRVWAALWIGVIGWMMVGLMAETWPVALLAGFEVVVLLAILIEKGPTE